MASQTDVDRNLKSMRELLPENGSNIPDEFILEILKANGNDLNKAYEEMQLRLERSSWESVDKTKKKKAEKQQSDHTFTAVTSAPRGRGRGRGGSDNLGRGDSYRPAVGGFSSPRDSGFTGSGNRGGRDGRDFGGRGGARNVGGKPITTETPAVNRSATVALDGADKKLAQPASVPDRPIPEPAPVPASNQWAKGKPKIENPQEKIVPPPAVQVPQQHAPVPPPPIPAPQPVAASPQQQPQQPQLTVQQLPPLPAPAQQPPPAATNEILAPVEQGSVTPPSWGAGQVETAAASNIKVPIHTTNGGAAALASHTPAHSAPAIGSAGASRSADTVDKSQDARYRERTSVPTNTTETDSLRNNFASLNVGQQTKLDVQNPTPQPASTPAVQSNGQLPFSSAQAEGQQMPYTMPQAAASAYAQPYAQYPQYSQQFAQMQSTYAQGQEGEDFNAGRMQGIGDAGYGMSGADSGVGQRGNAGNYGGKGAHGKQVQQPPQQPGIGMQQWQQGPLMNSYPGMAAAMYNQYAMAGIPAAQQLMYMQSFMGMPYAAGAIPGQMYNSTTGYPAQQNALGSKAPYTAQNANKKQQQYGNYSGPGYANPQYSQPETAAGASQDFYKSQGAPTAAFQQNYAFNYPGAQMSVPYDSMSGYQGAQQQGTQAAYAGRASALATGANGTGGAVDSSGMGYYPAFYGSQGDESQAQQWRTNRDRGQV